MDKKKSVAVVPGFWVTYNKTMGSLVTPFPPPPYNKLNTRELHKLIKNCYSLLDIWLKYSVELRGGVGTYYITFMIKFILVIFYIFVTNLSKNFLF